MPTKFIQLDAAYVDAALHTELRSLKLLPAKDTD